MLTSAVIGIISYRGCSPTTTSPVGAIDVDVTLEENDAVKGIDSFPASQTTVKYRYERSNADLKILYDLPYVGLLASGGPIESFGSMASNSKFTWQYPRIAIKIVNNGNRTVLLSDISIEVIASKINREPIPILMVYPQYDYDGRTYEIQSNSFDLVNEGWGSLVNAFVNYEARVKGETKCSFKGEKRSVSLGTFVNRATVAVWDQPTQERCIKAGESKRIEVVGTLQYETEDHQKRSTEFKTSRILGISRHAMGVTRVSAKYDVKLDAGKAEYIRNIPIAQNIKPGETDHFLLQLASDKSAHFDLRLSLRQADGNALFEKNIFIDIFTPQSGAEHRSK